jgi:hypothetical protein
MATHAFHLEVVEPDVIDAERVGKSCDGIIPIPG